MESWHVVGQKVVCVDFRPNAIGDLPNLRPGEVYTIVELVVTITGTGFRLVEVNPHSGYKKFRASRFRPIRLTSIERFRHFLTPTDEQVRVLEDA